MQLYSGKGRRLSSKKGGKRLSGGGKRLCSKRGGLAPVAGVLAIACCLGGLLWCAQAGFPIRLAQQAPDDSDSLFYPLHLSAPVQEEEGTSHEESPEAEKQDPQADRFVLSFAGDCTLGAEHDTWSRSGNFPDVVGDDYAYPGRCEVHCLPEMTSPS